MEKLGKILCGMQLFLIIKFQVFKIIKWLFKKKFRASFTKQGKLTGGSNSKTAAMGVEISAGDLLKVQIKEHRHTPHLHYQPNQYTKCSAN